MELTDPELLRALLQGCGNPTRVRLRRGAQNVAPPINPVSKGRKVRCKCGQCRQCLENARWERIFAEKFADPTYYTHPITHRGSSLTSLIQLGPSGE
jgi:hypothetical protein